MAIISKFLASKWVTVVLILALAGGAYYVYRQGKLLGSSSERSECQAITIQEQQDTLNLLQDATARKDKALANQEAITSRLARSFNAQRQELQETRDVATKALKNCLSMRISDGMQFGPSRENQGSEGEAGPDVDG